MKTRMIGGTTLVTALLALFVFSSLGWAAGAVDMPFRFRRTAGAATQFGVQRFLDIYYTAGGAYCTSDCRDPGGNKYDHGHLPYGFPIDLPDPDADVTAEQSDWAWNAYYNKNSSGSTFVTNCFAYSVGCSHVIFNATWTSNWTDPGDLCTQQDRTKATASTGHAVKIVHITNYPGCGYCAIDQTSEKNASSPIYDLTYFLPGGMNPLGSIRNVKQ
jgi:hypothetical protein